MGQKPFSIGGGWVAPWSALGAAFADAEQLPYVVTLNVDETPTELPDVRSIDDFVVSQRLTTTPKTPGLF